MRGDARKDILWCRTNVLALLVASRLSTLSSNNWLRFVDRYKVAEEDLKVNWDESSAQVAE